MTTYELHEVRFYGHIIFNKVESTIQGYVWTMSTTQIVQLAFASIHCIYLALRYALNFLIFVISLTLKMNIEVRKDKYK